MPVSQTVSVPVSCQLQCRGVKPWLLSPSGKELPQHHEVLLGAAPFCPFPVLPCFSHIKPVPGSFQVPGSDLPRMGCGCQPSQEPPSPSLTGRASDVRCHSAMSFSFSRERVLLGGQAASPLPPDWSAVNRAVENPTPGRDGLEETSRGYLIPAPCPTSAPASVISVRDIIISPGFTPQDTKWVRWDLRAHPVAAPCHEQGHCHQTRLPKPMQPLPGLSCSGALQMLLVSLQMLSSPVPGQALPSWGSLGCRDALGWNE